MLTIIDLFSEDVARRSEYIMNIGKCLFRKRYFHALMFILHLVNTFFSKHKKGYNYSKI